MLSPPPSLSGPTAAPSSGHRLAPKQLPPSCNSRLRLTPRRLLATSSSLAGAGDEASTSTAPGRDDGIPFAQLSSGIILRTEEQSLLGDDAPASASAFALSPKLPDQLKDDHLAEAPAYPAAMNALYAACLAGNATEQLWNFTWPAAVAMLHPASILPVAVLGFFTKLVVFAAGPLVGEVISLLPRIPAYRSLAAIQSAAHLVSAATITYAFAVHRAAAAAQPLLLLRPWFAVLVASTAVDRLSCVAFGIIAERDFVVQLAGADRPVALAKANATLSRVDLLCETAGASAFALLLAKNDPLTCIKLSCVISLCALPLLVHKLSNKFMKLLCRFKKHSIVLVPIWQIFMGGEMNRLADGIFDHSENTASRNAAPTFSVEKTVETVRQGWSEYVRQPVLPASLAYVLVCFNVALAPGALMTTFLIHQGVSPSVIGAFGGASAVVGIVATFLTARLVRELGILKAGAAGLVAQSVPLGAAVVVYLTGTVTRRGALFVFLGLIVASRAGHMAYSAVGLQVVQTGNPASKAKLIGATEIAVASLAELAMMAVAVVARDASHFGALAALSAAAVAGAAGMYCRWLANPTDELRRLFPSRRHGSKVQS
ncbi:solute carrier family 40 member 3, chloroplastic-like isoform X1 [Oryza brachyantha]|uniref:solute carrier family 40 member 3, chloroplastic-like isoform X1 n=1 Tax=Oryza brachyantha TaxID=4533 RepID=UPI001AD95642|nr:solute carrier family 40 member 3, chloroplastic-like isoform X1 [Oryza brachyantha]